MLALFRKPARAAEMRDDKLVGGAAARMEGYARKWLRHPQVKAIVHRRDADPRRANKVAL